MNIVVSDEHLRSMDKLNISSRFLYLILHGWRVMGRIIVQQEELESYSNMTRRTINAAIRELIDEGYITKSGKGKYTIVTTKPIKTIKQS